MQMVRIKQLSNYMFEYKTEIKVRDINYGGHLSNDAVAGLMHEARIDMLKGFNCTELDLGDKKIGLIMADLVINFKAEGRMHDKISIFCHIDNIEDISFRIYYKFQKGDMLIALAETGMVAYNYADGKIAEIPESFINAIK